MEHKILIAAPTSQHKDYCLTDFIENIRKFNIPADIFLVDNSIDPNYHKKIKGLGINCEYYNPKGQELKHVMSACNNIIREKVLSEGYSHLFSLEIDQFPTYNALETLISFNKDIVSIPYFVGEGENSKLLMYRIVKTKQNNLQFKELSLQEQAQQITGDLTNKISNNGIGCMLIKRNVLEKIKFRTTNEDAFADTHFHVDLFKHGIENWIYTGLISEHRNSNWDLIRDLNQLNKKNG